MRRHWHWAWAALASLVVAYAVLITWEWLCLGAFSSRQTEAPLHPVYRTCRDVVMSIAPWRWVPGIFFEVWFYMPHFIAALVTYGLLRRPARPEPLRCHECGQILKGLSEPRCPECGEQI